MRIIKKLFNKILFAVVIAVVFSLINRCEVKAYQVSQRSGVPYVYTNGTSASSISSIYEDLSSNAIGGFDYGCDNTFSSYNVINNLYSSSSGLCNYVLQSKTNLNEFYFGLNPMSSYDSNEPLPVFLKIEKPSGYDMMAVSSGSGISVVLFPSSSQPILGTESSSPYSGKITAVADNTFYFNITISSKTQYNPSKYYITSYMLNNTQYLYSTNQGGLSNLYYSPNSTNRTFLYFGTTSLTWPSANDGDVEQESSISNGPSLNTTLKDIKMNENIIGKNLTLEISNFSSDYRYFYQYINTMNQFDSNNFIELYEQNFTPSDDLMKFSTIYKQDGYFIAVIEDSEGNVIDSLTTHITGINENLDPEILLSVDYNSSNGTTIDEPLISADYYIYREPDQGDTYYCQWRFVPEGTSQENYDSISWTTLINCSDGKYYKASSNGQFEARIMIHPSVGNDFEVIKEILYVDEYGSLVSSLYGNGKSDVFSKYYKNNKLLRNFYDNGGPFSKLVSLPLNIVQFVFRFFSSSTSCNSYDMGTIFGQHLIIGCINLSFLGSNLLGIIDIIFAGTFAITWMLFLYKLFRKFVLLGTIDITNIFRGGIF